MPSVNDHTRDETTLAIVSAVLIGVVAGLACAALLGALGRVGSFDAGWIAGTGGLVTWLVVTCGILWRDGLRR